MSFDINNITLVGRLTKKPELKQTLSSKNVCTLSVANNTGKDENSVSYFDVQTWEAVALNCSKYLDKGSQVAITGRLQQQRWQKDGKNQSKVLIIASNVMFLSQPKNQQADPSAYTDASLPIRDVDDPNGIPWS